MRLATWNVNSIIARLPVVLTWLDRAKPDVVCIQETKCTDENFPAEELLERGYLSESFGQRAYNGVAILSRTACTDVARGFPNGEEDAQARLLAATVEGIRIVNVYVPNGSAVGADKYYYKLDWMRRLRSHLDSSCDPGSAVALCGDFNVAPEDRDVHDPQLWTGRVLFSEPERTALEEIEEWGFVDAFRLHNVEGGHFSWWDYRAGAFRRNLGLRIDHILVSGSLAELCTAAWIDKESRRWDRPSDHAPVIADFA